MKICFVSSSPATYGLLTGEPILLTGGAELQQSFIARSLSRSGFDVSFLVHDFDQPDMMTSNDGIHLVKSFGLKNPGLLLKVVKPLRLFRGMSLANADVYYQRASGLFTGLVSLYCVVKCRKFIFAVASDMDLDGTMERGMSRIERMLYRLALKRADHILVQTERQKDLLQKHSGREGIVVPNIYEMPDPEPVEQDYVLWAGSIRAVKRPQMFVDLARRMPEYKFVMVGGCMASEDEPVYNETLKAAEDVPNLKLTGTVPYSQVGSMYSRARVFVNTSIKEGFPNTYLDALSRRVPIVATFDPDGIIRKHNMGRHCTSPEEIADALREILENEDLRREMAENGYRYVKETHSSEHVTQKYVRILDDMRQS